AHLPEGHAARRDDRPDSEGRLVPHAAGRVLVGDLATDRAVEVDRLAAADHRVGQRERLGAVEPAEVDGHREGRHLVVGNVPARVLEDQLGELVGRDLLAVTLAADELGGVNGACSRIGWPGIPRDGAWPPSQRFTVAPTSANSPSWMRPSAFLPSTYASSNACSREWSVEGVVGSQPWSDVRMSRSRGRNASSRSGSRRSKSCRQRWKFTGSLRWPQSMSVSTRLVKISPSSTSRRSFSVCVMPSTFDFVGCDSSMSCPAKMSPILPTPCTFIPASRTSV